VYCLEIAKTSLYKPSLSNDSQYILTATSDYTVIVWRMEDGSQCMTLAAHEDDVTTSLFSPKDQIILTASKDIKAILWNFETGEQLFQLIGHNLCVNCAVFSKDGNIC